MKKILYVRSGPYQVDPNSYNLQELGLASAFGKKGYRCDVMYYHSKHNYDQTIEKNGINIKILWRKGIRIFRSGIYLTILKKSFLNEYDYVICSEYSQIMSYLLSRKHPNVYIYNGPYYNLFKIPFFEKIYDLIFCKKINNNVKKIFCKTKLAEDYINKKGLNKITTVGVGLDLEKFNKDNLVEDETKKIISQMEEHKNILYIGSISERKNTDFLIRTFIEIAKKDDNVQLIVIGKGNDKYVEYCKSLIPNELSGRILWYDFLKNSQTKYIYEKSDIFILPSKQEIFGMVLLESMYFKNIVVSSNSAGALTLIKNTENGFILDNFDEKEWANTVLSIMGGKYNCELISNNAKMTIENSFMWESIADKMIKCFEEN